MKSYFLAFITVGSGALAQQVKFERISLEQGLSQTSVFSIAQDQQGFLWFATQDGLNRYDGYSFNVFRHDPQDSSSLSDNYVTVVCVDDDGALWAGTRGGGLNEFNRETGQFKRHTSLADDPLSLSNDEIRCLYVDRQKTLWVGTTNGLNRYENSSGRFLRFLPDARTSKGLPEPLVQSLFEDSRGNFWIGLQHGLARMDRSMGEFFSVTLDWPVTDLVAIAEDNEGLLWFGTQDRLFIQKDRRWVPADDELKLGKTLTARRILKDSKGNIWFGTDAGLSRYTPARGPLMTFAHETGNFHSLSGNSVLSLFEDRNGILWIGTFDGINKYAAEKFKFDHIAWGAGDVGNAGWNKVRGFSEDRMGRIWVATQEGLMFFDAGTKTLRRFNTDSWYADGAGTRLLWALLADGNADKSELWAGTNGQGLVRLDLRTPRAQNSYKKYSPIPNDASTLSGPSPSVLYKTRDGTLWVGTLWEGLNRFDRVSGTFGRYTHDPSNPHSISSNEIWALCEDRSGNLWIGTAGGGLNKLDLKTEKFLRFSHNAQDAKSLSDDKVLSIVEDETGDLWIGTYSGLNRLNPQTGVFNRYTVDDGLANNVVYGILPDSKGNLWLSTNKGLSRFTPRTQKFRNFDSNDGLQSNEFNHGAAFRSSTGEIYFGGVNGFNVYFPEKIHDNPNIPEVVFTDFKVFNKSLRPSNGDKRLTRHISQADMVRLSYQDAVFSVEFAALEYTNPLKNEYAYKMEGFDDEWRYVGSKREATYTNLDAGDYIFRVKASNNDGVWNEKGASIRLVIEPPIWQTWWFRGLVVLAFLSVGPLIYYRRVTSLKKEKVRQEQVSRMLIENQDQERSRIARELHDSLGQELLIIKNRALMGLQSLKDQDIKARQQFEHIVETVSKSLKVVREISHNLRPPELDRLGLSETLRAILHAVRDATAVHVIAEIDDIDGLVSKSNEINVVRILQETLANILKHAEATETRVIIHVQNSTILMSLNDNGKGFDPALAQSKARGLGLADITERTRILNGTMHLMSEPGKGATYEFRFPASHDAKATTA